ncbi:MAG: hypothetical protein Q4G33_13190 [bacterium]|nr:hypothetical protein [bacterium]
MAGRHQNVYIIPENFIEEGKIFNGAFKIRNFIEAVILSLGIGLPLMVCIPYPDFKTKLTVFMMTVLPVFLIAVAGINGDSLIEFLVQFHKWRKNKRVMIYNGHTRSRAVRPADVMLAQELTKDKIVDTVDKWKEKRKQKNAKSTFIEGRDFEFIEDEEFSSNFVNTEKKILGEDAEEQPENKSKKKQKKIKGKKDQLLLNEGSTNFAEINDEDDAEIVIADMEGFTVTAVQSNQLEELGFEIEDMVIEEV